MLVALIPTFGRARHLPGVENRARGDAELTTVLGLDPQHLVIAVHVHGTGIGYAAEYGQLASAGQVCARGRRLAETTSTLVAGLPAMANGHNRHL